jgi:bifunctional NMN adenylyltransferase/nudix hydrolase
MIRSYFPGVSIVGIQDQGDDHKWSLTLDSMISGLFPLEKVTLYGSRGSFIPRYSGRFDTKIVDASSGVSATQIRAQIIDQPLDTRDFRRGVIYASANRWPVVHQTVDVAVIDKNRVLLGKRSSESKWRFVGGHVDLDDESLERAARRELREEAGDFEVSRMMYVCSQRVDDWRYKGRHSDGIMTSLFACDYVFGIPTAGDDIDEVGWHDVDQLGSALIVPEHCRLAADLVHWLDGRQTKADS